MIRIWPRSLAGPMALLVALALFVAQAINFAMLLRERRQIALEQVAGPAATRFVDSIERMAQGRPIRTDRGRVRLLPASPVRVHAPDEPAIASTLRGALTESGVPVGRIDTAIVPFDESDDFARRLPPTPSRK